MQKELIGHLEEITKSAKSMDVTSYFMVFHKKDGLTEIRYGQQNMGYPELIGYIECGKFQLLAEIASGMRSQVAIPENSLN